MVGIAHLLVYRQGVVPVSLAAELALELVWSLAESAFLPYSGPDLLKGGALKAVCDLCLFVWST